MSHPIPTAVPATLRAGDTATWRRTLSDYPANDGWTHALSLFKAAQAGHRDAECRSTRLAAPAPKVKGGPFA